MSKLNFIDRLQKVAGVKPALEAVEKARRGQSESELLNSVARLQQAEQSRSEFKAYAYLRNLMSDPQTRFELCAEVKHMIRARLNPDEQKHIATLEQKAMSEATQPGAILMSTLICQTIRELTPMFGAYSTLGVFDMPIGTTKFARVTAEPTGIWYSRAQQPDNLTSIF